jgi:hypothetical protein
VILKVFFHILFEDALLGRSLLFLFLTTVPEGEKTEVIISHHVGWSKGCEMWDISIQWILRLLKKWSEGDEVSLPWGMYKTIHKGVGSRYSTRVSQLIHCSSRSTADLVQSARGQEVE